jgi:signal transduction histidine kinase/AmiR/NasT family two-component response regulator
MKRFLSLGVILQAITGLMVIALIAACGASAAQAYQRREAAQRVVFATNVSRNLFDAMQGLRLERGAVGVALTAGTVMPDAAERLAGFRKPSDQALNQAIDDLSQRRTQALIPDRQSTAAAVARVQALRGRLLLLRAETEAALAQPLASRPAPLRAQWMDTSEQLVGALGQLSEHLAGEIGSADPFVAEMLRIKQLSWGVRDAAGASSMLMADLVAHGAAPTPAQRVRLVHLEGQVDAIWRMLQWESQTSATSPKLKAAIAVAEAKYFGILRPASAREFVALSAGRTPPMDRRTLNLAMIAGLNSFMTVADAAFDLMGEHAIREADRAERDFMTALQLMALATAFGLFAALLITGRVVRPIGAITEAMGAVAAGDLDREIPFERRGDEIGRLARALEVFRRNALEVRGMEAELVSSRVAKEAAEAANHMKSQFLANMSHEIRTPLNGVLGMVQVMEMEPLSPLQRERLGTIRDSGAALLQILNDVLDISKIEAGKLELSRGVFDLEGLVKRTVAIFADSAAAKGLDIEGTASERSCGAWIGDAERLRQVLGNLVSNAVKFTDRGAVSLRAERTAQGLAFIIRDSGIGMAPEAVPLLFNKFSQVDDSNERRFGGTGLGLAICRELIELMGGTIEVESVPGEGSTFRVELPAERATGTAVASPRSAPATVSAEDLAERSVRILAAEDNLTNQRVLQALLAPLGVDLVIVGDGRAAVEAWRREDFDLILMDIQMPGMGGVAASLAIRAEEAQAGRGPIPIVALSANAMSHQVSEYLAAGMTGYVAKPIDISALHDAIRVALDTPQDDQALVAASAG